MSAASLLAGCDSDVVPTSSPDARPYLSGARLRARVIEHEGATIARIGWQDTALDMPCRFLTASDGSTRCLP
ncbi:MAG TPA: hypothetical protein VL400_11205, partial [Polyangiaceae bacterium]|nr:hypothetical protein [Polyangiaceae bacterium]